MTTTVHDLRKPADAPPPNSLATRTPKTLAEINAMPQEKRLPAMLVAFKSQIAAALPSHITADRMARIALTAFRQNKNLAACDPMSVFKSVIVLAQMGLEVGIDGQAFLVPYRGECTPVPGWKGIVHLVNNAGKASVWAGAVFEGDKFDFQLGDEPYCRHQPTGQVDETRANLRFVYAIGKLKETGEKIIEVWPVAKVERHLKRFNKVGDKHYALKDDTNFIAYAKKVALLQVTKYLPKSVEQVAAHAIEAHGVGAVDLKDVIEGDWTNVTADAGEPGTEATAEDRTEAADVTLGQQAETLAREEAEQAGTAQTSAASASVDPSPDTGAGASESGKKETKPRGRGRVIE